MIGANLAGTDKRFQTFVLISGLIGFSDHYRDTNHPLIAPFRQATPPEVFEQFLRTVSPLDARHFIANSAPTPLLFQAARHDIGVSESESRGFYEAAGEPKDLRWYETGHDINDPTAFFDRQQGKLRLKHGRPDEVIKLPSLSDAEFQDLERKSSEIAKQQEAAQDVLRQYLYGGRLPSQKEIESDVAALDHSWSKFEIFANKYITHTDRKDQPDRAPSPEELDLALKEIREIFLRYRKLLTGDTSKKIGAEVIWD